MTRRIVLRLAVLLMLTAASADAQRRRILSLPGQPSSSFAQYSGYLEALPGSRLFYWLVESSETPPSRAPLVLWLNGGPGCSSLGGLLTTNGPFLVNDRAQLVRNPWAWNRFANMLYIESPVGVGFSYARNSSATPPQRSSHHRWNDRNTTRDNLLALRDFLRLFPEYRGREFHLTGESYAGVYLPLLAEAILTEGGLGLRLRGVAIGNGYFMGRTAMMGARAEFAYLMGLLPLTEMPEIGDATFNEYNVESLCHHNILGYNESYRCLNTTAMENYLQRSDVMRALGVPATTDKYHICSGQVFTNYEFRNETLTHQLLLLNASGVQVMLYNGNLDYLLPYLATVLYVDNITLPDVGTRMSWYYCQCMFGSPSIQVGGAETTFQSPTTIRYRSVLGAGHSAPIEKPEASYQLFLDFLAPQNRVVSCKTQICSAVGGVSASQLLLLTGLIITTLLLLDSVA